MKNKVSTETEKTVREVIREGLQEKKIVREELSAEELKIKAQEQSQAHYRNMFNEADMILKIYEKKKKAKGLTTEQKKQIRRQYIDVTLMKRMLSNAEYAFFFVTDIKNNPENADKHIGDLTKQIQQFKSHLYGNPK